MKTASRTSRTVQPAGGTPWLAMGPTTTVHVTEMPRGTSPADVPDDPTRRVVHLIVPPDLDNQAGVATALLRALGKVDGLRGNGRNASEDWAVAATWLTAHRTRWVIATGAQELSTGGFGPLLDTVGQAGARLVVAADAGRRQKVDHVAGHDAPVELEWDAWAVEPGRTTPEAVTPAPAATLDVDDLPDTGWATFRTACRALPAVKSALVETVYDMALRAALDHLARVDVDAVRTGTPAGRNAALAGLSVAAVDLVRDTTADTTGTAPVIVAAHAVAAAYATAGLRLAVHRPTLVGVLGGTGAPARVADEDWARLDGFRVPWHAAACALAGAGLTVEEFLHTTVADVTPDGTAATTADGRIHAVPTRAAVHARAGRLHALAEGLGKTATIAPEGTTARSVRGVLGDARDVLGMPLAGPAHERHGSRADRWQTRLGLTVTAAL